MKYWQATKLTQAEFKRLTGVKKIFKILSYPYRNRGKRFGLRANLIAGLHNYDLAN